MQRRNLCDNTIRRSGRIRRERISPAEVREARNLLATATEFVRLLTRLVKHAP